MSAQVADDDKEGEAEAVFQAVTDALVDAALDDVVGVELLEPDPGVLVLCLSIADDGPYEQAAFVPVALLSDILQRQSAAACATTALLHLVVEINGAVAVHRAACGQETDEEFLEEMDVCRSAIVDSELLAAVPERLRGTIDAEQVAYRIAGIIEARLDDASLTDLLAVGIDTDRDEDGDERTDLEITAKLDADREYAILLPLGMVLDPEVYGDFCDVVDMALTLLCEGLQQDAPSRSEDVQAGARHCRERILASGLCGALTDDQEQALRVLVALCAGGHLDGRMAAAQGVVTAERHGIPARIFGSMDGVRAAVSRLLDRMPEPDDIAADLARAIGRLPAQLAGPVAGFLYADMARNGLDPSALQAAVLAHAKGGVSVH